MSTAVTFAGQLAVDPELHTAAGEPFLTCLVLVNDHIRDKNGDRAVSRPTARHITVFGTSALNMYDSVGRGDRVVVHGQLRTHATEDDADGCRRTRQIVEVSYQDGEVGTSFRLNPALIERASEAVRTALLGVAPTEAPDAAASCAPGAVVGAEPRPDGGRSRLGRWRRAGGGSAI